MEMYEDSSLDKKIHRFRVGRVYRASEEENKNWTCRVDEYKKGYQIMSVQLFYKGEPRSEWKSMRFDRIKSIWAEYDRLAISPILSFDSRWEFPK